MKKSGNRSWAILAGATLALSLAAAAWACTVQPRVHGLSFQGTPGTVVQLEGTAFPKPVPVEIRWNGSSGEVLARAAADSSGSFSVPLTIPATAPAGVHSLVAVGGGYAARTAFEVLPAAADIVPRSASGGASDLWQGFDRAAGRSAEGASAAPRESHRRRLALGAGLVSMGLAALAAAGASATMRRPVAGRSRWSY